MLSDCQNPTGNLAGSQAPRSAVRTNQVGLKIGQSLNDGTEECFDDQDETYGVATNVKSKAAATKGKKKKG